MIPTIDISPLFDPDSIAKSSLREPIDRRICDAARDVGFMTITGVPHQGEIGPDARTSLIRLFEITGEEQRRLWKKNFAPENPNLYRGWFPLESGETGARQGFDIGPDLVRDLPEDGTSDLLYEPSCFPNESRLPGWRRDAETYYHAMESIGAALLASLSRGIGIPEHIFRDGFHEGISTLRLVHYVDRPFARTVARDPTTEIPPELAASFVDCGRGPAEIVCGGHYDTGLVTILGQCDVDGLQVRLPNGEWVDIPPTPDGFVINFGGLLARWTGGHVRATMHRVLSKGDERYSIPFFFEPRPDTRIEPLPIPGIRDFEPFLFGDHLWATTTKFSENFGLGHLRPARAPYQDPF